MREIVLDTETTGLDPEQGDRIVEIGAVELWNHMPTGETWQEYINPQRSMPSDAFRMHGIGADLLDPPQVPEPGAVTLKDKPIFERIAQAFLDFVGDSRLVIHNVEFDLKFLNAELVSANLPEIPREQAIDTLYMARRKYPGAPASLDALRRRFDIDRSRTLHGALLDSEILAEVYLELIGGRQPDFDLSRSVAVAAGNTRETWKPYARPNPLPSRVTKGDVARHSDLVAELGPGAMWLEFESVPKRSGVPVEAEGAVDPSGSGQEGCRECELPEEPPSGRKPDLRGFGFATDGVGAHGRIAHRELVTQKLDVVGPVKDGGRISSSSLLPGVGVIESPGDDVG